MAVENGVQNAELGYLLFPFEQYSNLAGKPLVGGHMEIYEAGTDTKYISYQNWDGAENPFKIPLPADGRITVLADPTKTFDCYLYDSYNNLVCSRLNVQCNVPGNISIKGADTIIKNTDGTLDVSLRTLGNNVREYTVNTHNKILDVQEPLYFVENSNTATVIGFSGDNYATTADLAGKMDISKLEYNEDGEISAYDGSAFAGQGAGDPEVNELVHSNSATWNDVSAKLDTTAFSTVSGNFLTAIPDDYATKDYVQSSVSSKLDSTAFSTVSGSFLTAHQDLSDYLTKVSADGLYYPLNSNPSGYLTAHQSLADYLTKASADTLYQPTGDYATHDDLTAYQTVEGMTAYQPSGNYADATALDGKVDTSSFTAFSSTTNEKIEYISGALSGTYELSAGEGIDITDYPNEQKTVISVTAQGGNPEVENLVIANSATWDSVTGKQDNLNFGYNNTAISSIDSSGLYDTSAHARINTLAGRINALSSDKLDTTAFSTVSGDFLTAHQDLSNYATTASVAEKLDTTAFSTVSGNFLTAHQDISDLMPKSESANFYPMTGNPSGFLTAHQDLSDYATTAQLADKLDTTAFSDVSGTFLTAHQDISNKLDTTAFSDVSGSFLTAVPDTYLQNTDLTISEGKITEISGVPLSAGDELPSGVMNTSALEYNAVNEISGYNGSAIAQYGAEKQWLVHDDTLVHAANSAQYALGVNLSAVAQLLGVDETVLWTNDSPQMMKYQTVLSGTLSEPCSAFNMLRFICKGSYDYGENFSAAVEHQDFYTNESNLTNSVGVILFNRKGNTIYRDTCQIDFAGNTFTAHDGSRIQGLTALSENLDRGPYILKVIGIGRKQ